jgi:hypothetical protein
MVGGVTESCLSPAPTIEASVSKMAQQAVVVDEPQVATEERWPESSSTTGAVEPGEALVQEETLAEAGLVDIANILGAPTVTVVQSSL